MFVYLPYRGRYGVVATLTALAIGGCSDPSQRTDLRPEGPPDVLAVMVMDDAANGIAEKATYCRKADDKRPSLVGLPDGSTSQICPLDGSEVKDGVNDAYPQGWYVRIMFDELLDPSIEDLTEIVDADGNGTGTYEGSIAASHPVELRCTGVSGAMVDVPYDGYYSPSGNNVTWPLGPSLVITPNFPATVPTTASCQITINDNVFDKNDHLAVPADERGPFAFEIAPINVAFVSPGDGESVDGVDAGIDVLFNTAIDPNSIDDTLAWAFDPVADAVYSDGFVDNGGVAEPVSAPDLIPIVGGKAIGAAEWFVGADFYAKTDYTWTIPEGSKLKDLCGVETTFGPPSVDDQTQVTFSVNDLTFTGITPTDGTMAATPSKKIQLKFNQPMNPDSLKGHCSTTTTQACPGTPCPGVETCVGAKFDVTPAVTNLDVIEDPADLSKLDIYGDFALDTDYTFTLNASTTIDECPGAEWYFGGPCGANPRTYLNADQQVVHFHTAPAIALTGMSPADNASITKVEPVGLQARTSVTLTFNQEMDPSTFTQGTDFTIEPNVALSVGASPSNFGGIRIRPTRDCDLLTPDFTTCSGYAPGTYTFTLKAGAQFDDYLGNTYTQPTDEVIHFTISDPDPTPDCLP
jgi:hypothetical protein